MDIFGFFERLELYLSKQIEDYNKFLDYNNYNEAGYIEIQN